MTRQVKDLRNLSGLTATALAARQAALRSVLARELALRQQLDDLDRAVADRAATVATAPDAAVLAGADMRWHVWIEDRRAALFSTLARTLAEKETHRDGLALAFGRDQATARLLDRALADTARVRQRKADNGF